MAVYKVLQDIEAEDKLVGPLTLRQFIYAGVAVLCAYLSFLVATKGLAFLLVVFLPPVIVFGFLAFPWGRDQPTEIWALAKIRFMLKPRRRIWDQSGVKELVTITAPKVVQKAMGRRLSETEVKSRLRALADTIDSRGWAIKSAAVSLNLPPAISLQAPASDRLLNVDDFAQTVPISDIQASDDMLDEANNPNAQRVNSMIQQAEKAHRQKLITEMNSPEVKAPAQPKPANNYWFLNEPSQPLQAPSGTVTFNTQVVTPGSQDDNTQVAMPPGTEAEIVRELEEHKQEGPNAFYYGHLKTIAPLSQQPKKTPAKSVSSQPLPPIAGTAPLPVTAPSSPQVSAPTPAPQKPQVTPEKRAAILDLARNKDLNVATIAREINRGDGQNEVVIKLH